MMVRHALMMVSNDGGDSDVGAGDGVSKKQLESRGGGS